VVLWSAAALVLTLGPLAWHLNYFARPGPQYRTGIAALLCVLGLGAAVYARFRRKALWRWEPRLLAGAALAATLLTEPLALAVCAWMAVACYAAGAFALARCRIEIDSPAARIPLATGAGLGCLILVLFPLGLAGLYRPWVFVLLLAAPCIAFRGCIRQLGRDLRSLDDAWRSSSELQSPLAGVAAMFAPAFLAAFLMAALSPAISYDAVAHHLPAARHYLLQHELTPLPGVPGSYSGRSLFSLGHSVAYSYYPQSFEELLTVAEALGGQPAAQLVTPLLFALTLLLSIAIARLCGLSRLGAVFGAAAAATLPFAHWTGAVVKNDYPLALFELAALYAVLRARKRSGAGDDGSVAPAAWLLLAAFFLGLSFGVKHVALFGAIPLGLLLLDEIRRRRGALRLAALAALLLAASGAFWHARTYLLTGNPIYPARSNDASRAVRALDGSRPSRWTVHLLYPWIAHFDGHKVLESPTANPLGFFFVFFASAWAVMRRRERSREERACLFFIAIYYLYWAYIWGVLRYALAPVIVLAFLTAGRAAEIVAPDRERETGRALRFLLPAALAYCLAFALLPVMILEVNARQLEYFAGKLDRPGYLRAALADYPAIEFLNQHVRPGEQTLSVDNCAAAYANNPEQFRCVRFFSMLPDRVQLVGELVESTAPDYFVLPSGPAGDPILARLDRTHYGEPIYSDAAFQILRRQR
jgi:Dolichyl-phosphate-mannose-protein mannosyltransferase